MTWINGGATTRSTPIRPRAWNHKKSLCLRIQHGVCQVDTGKPNSLSWTEVGKRAVHKASGDDISMRAAQLAYYFFLSIFPLAIVGVAALGIFAASSAHFRHELFTFAGRIGPASPVLRKTITQISSRSGGTQLGIGIVIALWSASSGMSAVMDALNRQHGIKQSRPFVKRSALAIALTIAVGILLLLAIGTALVGSSVISAVGGSEVLRILWDVARWPVVLFFALVGFDLIYHFAPRVQQKWRWFSAGSITALVVWIVASVAFRVYVAYFANYSSTYGSLGAVIVLLLWFYITGLAILIGSEVNIVIEQAGREPAALDHAA